MKSLLLVVLIALVIPLSVPAQTGWVFQTNPLGSGENAMIGKVHFVNSSEGWIAGGKGNLLHTTNAGADWMLVTPFPSDTISGMSDPAINMSWADPNTGWILYTKYVSGEAAGAVIFKTTDAGANWTKINLTNSAGDNGIQIQFVDQNNGWAVTFNFGTSAVTFLKTTDGGTSWAPFNGAGLFYFTDINNGWAYTASGPNTQPPYKIYHTTNGGTDWTEQYTDNTPGEYNAIKFTDVNNGWIIGNQGKVLRTTNGGTNWSVVANTGINPNQSCKTVFFSDNLNGWIPSKDNSGKPYIQHTTDGGITWSTQNTPMDNSGNNAIFSIFFVDAANGWLTADGGIICHTTTGGGISGTGEENKSPVTYSLNQNYPNPFNPSTTISYSVAIAGRTTIHIYDALGNEISRLLDEEKNAGTYNITWDAADFPSGIYFCRMQAGDFVQTMKITLIK